MHATREQVQREALSRAASGQSLANLPTIIAGFAAKGIPADDVKPRENVFTYHAWRALGRQVRRGEHGVRVVTFIPVERREGTDGDKREKGRTFRRPWSATVFHVSQTDPVA